MQEKFERLFHEFQPEDTNFGPWSGSPQAYFHGEEDIPGATLVGGYQIIQAPVDMDVQPLYHRDDENLVFLGASFPDVFASWDAEVHFYMGKDLDSMEKVVITEPTIIKVPKGWFHGPLKFVRVDKPILFQALLFNGIPGWIKKVAGPNGPELYYSQTDCHRRAAADCQSPDSLPWTVINEDGVVSYSDTGSYDPDKAPKATETVIRPGYASKPYSDATALKAPKPALSPETTKLVLAMPKEVTKWGAWCPSPQAYFRGDIYMENANYNVGWQIFTAANDMENPHFHQGADELIFFMGADPQNIFDFDCEIEFFIGDDPDHMESKIFTRPFVVRLPPTVWHCPIRFRKVNKPVTFQAAFLHGTWGTINRVEGAETAEGGPFGRNKYSYLGDNVRFCKFNPQKRCNICGACFPDMEIKDA